MKYTRRTAGYTWTDYKTNAQIVKELITTQILDKLLEYKRSWIQHVNRMPWNTSRLPRVMKHYSATGRRIHGRPLRRLLDTWDQNGTASGPTPWKIYDDDDDDVNWITWLQPACCSWAILLVLCKPPTELASNEHSRGTRLRSCVERTVDASCWHFYSDSRGGWIVVVS